jgi:hypothetical protein
VLFPHDLSFLLIFVRRRRSDTLGFLGSMNFFAAAGFGQAPLVRPDLSAAVFNLVHQPAAGGFISSRIPVLARIFRCELKAPVRSGRFSCHRRPSWIFPVLFSVIAVSLADTVALSENHYASCCWIDGPRVFSGFRSARSGPVAQLPPKVFFVLHCRGPATILFVIAAGLRFSATRPLVSSPGLVTEVRRRQRFFPNCF